MKTLNRYVWFYLNMVMVGCVGSIEGVAARPFVRHAIAMVTVACFFHSGGMVVRGTDAPTVEPTAMPTVNEAPRIQESVGVQRGRVGDEFTFQLVKTQYFSDAQGDDFTLAAVAKNETRLYDWLSFDARTQTFSGVPGKGGGYAVEVRATDTKGATSDPLFFTIQVERKSAEDYRLMFDILKVLAPIIAVFVGLVTTAYCCALCRKHKKKVEEEIEAVNDMQEQEVRGGRSTIQPVYVYRKEDQCEQTMLVADEV